MNNRVLLTALSDVKETLRMHTAMLQAILEQLQTNNTPAKNNSLRDFHFPQEEKNIDQLELKLSDQSARKALVSFHFTFITFH